MNKEIMLEVKNKYGRDLIYPSCHIANALIKLKDKIMLDSLGISSSDLNDSGDMMDELRDIMEDND